MPLLKNCAYPGCRCTVPDGVKYCERHANADIERKREIQRKRPQKTAAQRGYSYAWQKARASFLRMNPLCKMCQEKGIIKQAEVVDHIQPHKGNADLFWDRSNWQPLCKQCHDIKTATEDGGFGNKQKL